MGSGMENLWSLLVLLAVVLTTSAGFAAWTWWLTKDRQRPLQGAADAANKNHVLAMEIMQGLNEALTKAHEQNVRILEAFSSAACARMAGGIDASLNGDGLRGQSGQGSPTDVLAVADERIRRSREQRMLREHEEAGGIPVDPDGEGFDPPDVENQ